MGGSATVLDDAWEYSFDTMAWTLLSVTGTVTTVDTTLCTLSLTTDFGVTPGTCAAAGAAATCALVAGAYSGFPLDTVDTAETCSSTLMAVPAARYLHTAVQLGSKMFLYGGQTQLGHSNELWELDLSAGGSTGVWSQLTPLSGQPLPALYGATAVPMLTLSGDPGFLLFGGNTGYGLATQKAYHYDATIGCLAEVAAVDGGSGVPTGRFQHGAAGVAAQNEVTVMGGRSYGADLVSTQAIPTTARSLAQRL